MRGSSISAKRRPAATATVCTTSISSIRASRTGRAEASGGTAPLLEPVEVLVPERLARQRGGGGGTEAVEHDRHVAVAKGGVGTGDRGDLGHAGEQQGGVRGADVGAHGAGGLGPL